MRALVAELSNTRAAWTVATSKFRHDAAWRRGGVLSLVDLPVPVLPRADGWVRVRPTLSGVCGSDLKLLHVTGFSPLLSAYSPQPSGRARSQVTGVVEAAGPGVTRVREGDAVLVEPTLRSRTKGCPSAAAAGPARAISARTSTRRVSCASVRASASPTSSAVAGATDSSRTSRCSRPRPGCLHTRAVLAEPASVALHAALRWKRSGDTAVVIGPGTIGLLVTATLRRLHPDLDITVVCAGEFGARQAMTVGATRTVQQPSSSVIDTVADTIGARRVRPRFGKLPVLDGGVDVVFDCVTSAATIDLGLRLLRGGGTFVMVGTAARAEVEWSLVWFRELTIRGAVVYGEEPGLGGRRTFDVMGEWLADDAFPVDGIVTHSFPLEQYAEALESSAGPAAQAVKVVLHPTV